MSNLLSQKKHRERVKARGTEINEREAERGSLVSPEHIQFHKAVVVRIPYDAAISKNRVYGRSSNGQVFLKPEGKAIREHIYYEIKSALNVSGFRFHEAKVWIDIFVEMPTRRTDAINVIDAVCDSIKKAIGIDDRWFAIRRLDWSIVKTKPQMTIKIGQEHGVDQAICRHCGKLRTKASMRKGRKNGDIECVDCDMP